MWGSYLYGRRFLPRTDHNAVRWLMDFKSPRGQLARWLERPSDFDFDFEVQQHSGRLRNSTEGLPRFQWDGQGDNHREVESKVACIQSVNIELFSKESTRAAQSRDSVLTQVVMWLKPGVRPLMSEAEGGGRKRLIIITLFNEGSTK